MLREIVLDDDEFSNLSKGQVRWSLQKTPVQYSNMGGGGVVTSGTEFQIVLVVSAVSKAKDPQRIISMKINLGVHNKFEDGYTDKLERMKKAAIAEFPKSKEGGFE